MMTREERLALEQRKRELERLQQEEAQRQEEALGEDRGFVDTPVGDLLGNFAWGFGESLVLPTVADIASKGELSRSFGSDEWKDESLAGKVGYALGTGAGIISGIGTIGKGLGAISKLANAGVKPAGKKVAKEIFEKGGQEIGEELGEDIIKTGRKAIKEGLDAELNGVKPWSYFTRRALKTNPLANPRIEAQASKIMTETLVENIPNINPQQLTALTKMALGEAGESLTKTFGNSISTSLRAAGVGPRISQIVGDSAYEAVLLGTFDTLVGEAGEIAANIYELEESDAPGLFKPWYARALHGAALGSVLAPTRYIPGGKAVQFGKSGMMADIGHIGRGFRNRFRNVERMTPGQLQLSLKTMWGGAGKPVSWLSNVKGFSTSLLDGKLKPEQVDILRQAFRQVKKEVFPHRDAQGKLNKGLIANLASEIGRDGAESFWRASIGSLLMNGTMYYESRDIIGTEDYPYDKLLADHYIGMIYMKRGKTFEGRPKMPRFFEKTGVDGTGGEINSWVKTMDILGYKPEVLDKIAGMARVADNEKAIGKVSKAVDENSPELKKIHDKVRENLADADEIITTLNADKTGAVQIWQVHAHKKIADLTAQIAAEKNTSRKSELQAELKSFKDQFFVASKLQDSGEIGAGYKKTRPMTAEETDRYIQELNSIRVDGRILDPTTVETVLKEKRQNAVGAMSESIRNNEISYIIDSFESLGIRIDLDPMGKPQIHKTAVDLLESIKSNHYRVDETGQTKNIYVDSASALHNAIIEAQRSGFVSINSDKGGQLWRGALPTEDQLSRFNALYKTNAEKMHQLTLSEDGLNWREIVPHYSSPESGFPDPNIMASKPVWHAMHTWELHERNRKAYEIFTKSEGNIDRYNEIIGDIYSGNERLEFTAQDLVNVSKENMQALENLNLLKGMLSPDIGTGIREITKAQFEKVEQNIVKELGSYSGETLLNNQEVLSSFMRYTEQQITSKLTGNPNLGTGLRRALVTALNANNPFAYRKGNVLHIVEADKIETLLLQYENTGGPEKNAITEQTRKLIRDYKQIVENPLKRNLTDVSLIRFNRDNINLEYHSPQEIKQFMQEMIVNADRVSALDLESLMYVTSGLNKTIKDVITESQKLVESDGTINKELSSRISDLSLENNNLLELLSIYQSQDNIIGFRSVYDRMHKLSDLNQKMQTDSNVPDALRDYTNTLRDFIVEQRKIQEQKLNFDEIQDINSYTESIIDNLRMTDRSGKIHAGNTSISDSQYAARWFNNDMTKVEQFKKNPIELIRGLEKLTKEQERIIKLVDDASISGDPISGFDQLQKMLGMTHENYIDIFIKPVVESQKASIEAKWELLPPNEKGKSTSEQMYQDFVMDTMFIMQSGLANTKFPMAVFNNGVLELSHANISTWNTGIVKLEQMLGLQSGQLLLAGNRWANERTIRTRLTPDVMRELNSIVESGVGANINPRDILSTGDKAILEQLGTFGFGDGRKGTAQTRAITLDEKTMVFLHQNAFDKVIQSWSSPTSENRRKFEIAVGDKAKAEDYLRRQLGAEIDKNGNAKIKTTGDNAEHILLMTRMLGSFHDDLSNVVNKNNDIADVRKLMKYLKLDSPRTGMALDKTTADFAKIYLDRMLPQDHILRDGYDTFLKHTFNPDGSIKPQRTLTIRDEGGTPQEKKAAESFFNTQVRGMKDLTQKYIKERGMSEAEARNEAEAQMEVYENINASIVNGEKYLSLPEMTSILMQKGARSDWFTRDEDGKITGFNVVVKPIELDSRINISDGSATVYVGKTAYKYDPVIDSMMKDSDGNYMFDSITFKSAVKKNAVKSSADAEYQAKIFNLPEISSNDLRVGWKEHLGDLIKNNITSDHIYELPREAIFIKSISGEHDATMSSAFTNFFTKDATDAINSITGSQNSVRDVLERHAQLSESPFASRKIVEHLKGINYEHGDNLMQVMGIEGIIQSGGIPSFEYMAPQIEKMVVSEYLGRRNFTSSQMKNGAYEAMTAGDGLSIGIREGGTQTSFGGSGMSYYSWNKPISGLFKGNNEGISLIFNVDKSLAAKYKEFAPMGIKEGVDLVYTFDGQLMGPGLDDIRFGIQRDITAKKRKAADSKLLKQLESDISKDYKEIVDRALQSGDVHTIGDFVMYLDGRRGESIDPNLDFRTTNNTAFSMAKTIAGGNSYKNIHLAKVDLRTPMVGANDRVITKVEKLLNHKKGPVSEMNYLDVIDTQDADFDLDKSSSFFALPGKVIKEIYNFSGYQDPAKDVFFKVLEGMDTISGVDVEQYRLDMMELAAKRPALVRSHSVSSFLYQLAAVKNKENELLPGLRPDYYHKNSGMELFEHEGRRSTYTVKFKGGAQFVDAIQNTKSLIKETIDIYKNPSKIDPKQIENMLYEKIEGMFEIYQTKMGAGDLGQVVQAVDVTNKDFRKLHSKMVREIMLPIAEIFNIANMTEYMSDGSRRKMSLWEVNNAFQSAKRKISLAGHNHYKGKDGSFNLGDSNELKVLSNDILRFLGDQRLGGSKDIGGASLGQSSHPLIKGLIAIENSLRQNFKRGIPSGSDLASMMASSTPVSNDRFSSYVKKTIKDRDKWAEMEYVAWEVEQIENVLDNLRMHGRRGGSINKDKFETLKNMRDNRKQLVSEFNLNATYSENKFEVKDKAGSTRRNYPVLKFIRNKNDKSATGYDVFPIKEYKPGQLITYRKGEILAQNYAKVRIENGNVSAQRRAMSRAFARQIVTDIELMQVNSIVKKYKKDLNKASKLLTQDGATSFNKFGVVTEAHLRVLSDAIKDIQGLSMYGRSEVMTKQLLYNLLAPKVRKNTYDIVGYNALEGRSQYVPSFHQNKYNERLVFSFLDRAKTDDSSDLGKDIAGRLHKDIVDNHMKAYMLEYNPALKGDAFKFQGAMRDPSDRGILPKPKTLPEWALDPNLDNTAKNVMLSYLSGSYFMDPVELYRATYNLYGNKLNEVPNPTEVIRFMNESWKGVDRIDIDPDGHFFNSRSIYEKGTNFQLQSKGKNNAEFELKQKYLGEC